MPELEELEEAIQLLSEHHENIGYSEPDFFEEERDEVEIRGYTVVDRSDGMNITVSGSTGSQYVSIRFNYDLVQDISGRIGEEAAEKYVGEQEEEEDESIETKAALNLLREIDDEEQKNIQYQLYDIILQPRVWSELDMHEEEFVTGFRVRGRLYPFDCDVSIRDYEYQLSHTLTPGVRGWTFLLYTLNMMDAGDNIGGLEEMASVEVSDS